MKTIALKTMLTASTLFLLFPEILCAQAQYLGIWEGLFMNDFYTVIELNSDNNNGFSGRIKMFSGENLIQNDELSKITFTNNQLTFYIDLKQTEFKGEFNEEVTELNGEFIFPDDTKHTITLSNNRNEMELKGDSSTSYFVLKNKKFTADELKNDFNYLVEKLVEFHPNLFAYTPKTELNKLISETSENIDSELTVIEFFKRVAPLVERIKCSHTGIRLPQKYQEEIIKYDNFLPLKLLFKEEKVYCLNTINSTDQIAPGSEILTINNISTQKIKEMLYKFIPSEGENITTKDYYLNQNFNLLYNLIDNSPMFITEYRSHNSSHTASLRACNYSELYNNENRVNNEKPLDFIFNGKKNIGFLTVKSFIYPDINTYIQEMDTIFYALYSKNAKHLVIDLRGNSGGHPIFAAQLFSYLTNKEFTYFKRNEDVKEFEPLYNPMSPNKLQFNGNIYVFVDGGCLSTTGHLISLMKYHTNAIFIGEEPGSTFRCNNFSVKENLPNTRIEVNIPRTTFETAIGESEKISPFVVDYRIKFSVEEYLKEDDSYIKFINGLVF